MSSGRSTSRWYHLTQEKYLLGLLLVMAALLVADRFSLAGLKRADLLNVQLAVALLAVGSALWLLGLLGRSLLRRPIQFHLRSLVLLTAIAALPCGLYAIWTREGAVQRDTLRKIQRTQWRILQGTKHRQRVGDAVQFAFAGRDEVVGLSFRVEEDSGCGCCYFDIPTDVTDDELRLVAALRRLRSLELPSRKITDAGLACLRDLTELRRLVLDHGRITDAGLTHLRKLKNLEELSLAHTEITDYGLRHLGRLKSLRVLNLNNTSITDAGFERLKGLYELQELSFANTRATGSGVKYITGCGKLTRIHGDLRLTSKEVLTFNRFKNLEGLAVNICDPSTRGAPGESIRLANLSRLKSLTLADQQGLETIRLSNLPALTSLNLSNPTCLELQNVPNVTHVHVSGIVDADFCRALGQLTRLCTLTLPDGVCDPEALTALGQLPELTRLVVGGRGLTDASLSALAGIPKVRHLQLSGEGFSDHGLSYLRHARQLEWLQIFGIGDSVEPLASLRGLTNLQRICLADVEMQVLRLTNLPKLDHVIIAGKGRIGELHLANLPQLCSLSLDDPHAVRLEKGRNGQLGFGTIRLKGLPRLRELELGSSTPATWWPPTADRLVLNDLPMLKKIEVHDEAGHLQDVEMAKLPALELLYLPYTGRLPAITDRDLLNVDTFLKLKCLRVADTGITDRTIEKILGLPDLRHLNINHTQVSDAAFDKLRKTRPEIRVFAPRRFPTVTQK